MIDPKQFYSKDELPDAMTKQRMWKSISMLLFPVKNTTVFMFDRKSFVYGMAASFILMFTCIGVYSTVRQFIENSQPNEIKADKAYQTAINEFEHLLYSTNTSTVQSQNNDLASVRKNQLRYLNEAIDKLKQDMNSHDLSPLKRQRLFELYTMKLTLLQNIIQQGEIES